MVRDRVDVVDALGLAAAGGGATDTLVEGDRMAGWLALKGAQGQHARLALQIEADPVEPRDFLHDEGRGLGGVGQPVAGVEQGGELAVEKIVGRHVECGSVRG